MAISAEEIKKRAYALKDQITQDRRILHQMPEIGTDLPETSAYIKKRLDEMEIPWKDCGGPLPGKMTDDFVEGGISQNGEGDRCYRGDRTRKPVYPSKGRHGCAADKRG